MNIKQKIKDAAELLGKRGRRIDFIFFGLILVFVSIAPIFIGSYVEYFVSLLLKDLEEKGTLIFSDKMSTISLDMIAFYVMLFAVLAFITAPVYYCFFRYAYQTYRNGMAGKPKFLTFGKNEYWKSLMPGMIKIFIVLASLLPLVFCVKVLPVLAFSIDERLVNIIDYLFVLVVAAGLVVGFFVFLLFRPLFLFSYYTVRGEDFANAMQHSVKRMRSPRAKQIYKEYIKAFLPSLLLSIATVLVLFFVDTLPKMSLVYFDVAEEIIYGEEQ